MTGPDGVMNVQSAPYPSELADLVSKCAYRQGWRVWLEHEDRGQGSVGLTLNILVDTVNSYPPHQPMRVRHLFIVPAASYNRVSWQRWLLEQFLLVERHEACEFFTIDGEKPYAPHHGPGFDPYIIFDHGDDLDRRTSFRGEVKPAEGSMV